MADLASILQDDDALLRLAASVAATPAALRATLLDEEPFGLVTQLGELSQRRIIRQYARASADKFGSVVEHLRGRRQSGEHKALNATLAAVWPSYMRHTPSAESAEAGQVGIRQWRLHKYVINYCIVMVTAGRCHQSLQQRARR